MLKAKDQEDNSFKLWSVNLLLFFGAQVFKMIAFR